MGDALSWARGRVGVWALAALALAWAWPTQGRAAELAPGRGDIGLRAGILRPFGAYDRGTRATDTTFGATSVGIDAALRLGPPARWSVELGGLASAAATVPTLCASTSTCLGSVGRDFELDALARLRGPRWRPFVPEAELGTGWSWVSRSLEDESARSTRHWGGPVFVRAAVVPTFVVGRSMRIGIVLGGSIAGTASSRVLGPGVDQTGLHGGVHGGVDLGVRFALDVGR